LQFLVIFICIIHHIAYNNQHFKSLPTALTKLIICSPDVKLYLPINK
jgi:hypothetical protein